MCEIRNELLLTVNNVPKLLVYIHIEFYNFQS